MEFADGLSSEWERIGQISVDQLIAPRRELHRAAHFPAAVGRSLARSQPQQIHRTLRYRASIGALVSRESASTGVYLGLAIAEARLVFVGPGGSVLDTLEIDGRGGPEIWEWIETLLEETGTDGRLVDREHSDYQLPEPLSDEGEAFQIEHRPAFGELARQLANAHRMLSAVGAMRPRSTPVRTWPDGFETSVYTRVDPRKRLGQGEFVEYGFSGGDDSYDEPYWYVVPHPDVDEQGLPDLAGRGFWHRKKWVGAVLPVSRLYGADDQFGCVAEFLSESESAASELVEGRGRARRGAE